ncbi:GH25 family lysozyme [Carnobacterium gallinarum]|uniref:GH25 family lysozyme n=1 Tax=Carnobacterium gallinarum TaxID=2749 RepID=UPI000556BF1E|nr:GH25 family lysozyme [Carnobacterium gallinarum]
MSKTILDISEWQVPSSINYDQLASQVELVIIRVQYGSNYVDKHYKTHSQEFKKRGVPVAVYAWIRGVNITDMEQEATDFYNRAKEFNPSFWWLDVEEESMADMRTGCSAYLRKLKSLGAQRVGVYIAHHLYKRFNLNLMEVDGVWIPHYGSNDGKPNSQPDFLTDLHQYTSTGRLSGYGGDLDLNRLLGVKKLAWFTGAQPSANNNLEKPTGNIPIGSKVKIESFATAYSTGERIPDWVKAPTYSVIEIQYKKQSNSTYRYLLSEINSWVLEQDIRVVSETNRKVYRIEKGDSLWGIAEKVYGTGSRYIELKQLNNLTTDLIQPGQTLTY